MISTNDNINNDSIVIIIIWTPMWKTCPRPDRREAGGAARSVLPRRLARAGRERRGPGML